MAGFVQRPIAAAAGASTRSSRSTRCGPTPSASTARTTTTRCGRSAASSASHRAFHSSAMGWQNRASISSYVYNHVGMLGESHHALAKSLFLGGVTRRFPDLNFGFLEGGVAWAASLYADLIGHFEKRNGEAMRRLDPTERRLGRVRRPVRAATAATGPAMAPEAHDVPRAGRRPARRVRRRAASSAPRTSATCSRCRSSAGARPTTR